MLAVRTGAGCSRTTRPRRVRPASAYASGENRWRPVRKHDSSAKPLPMTKPSYVEALDRAGVMEALAAFDPHVAGTPPLGLDLPGSDTDVLCHAPDAAAFAAAVWSAVGEHPGFAVRQWVALQRGSAGDRVLRGTWLGIRGVRAGKGRGRAVWLAALPGRASAARAGRAFASGRRHGPAARGDEDGACVRGRPEFARRPVRDLARRRVSVGHRACRAPGRGRLRPLRRCPPAVRVASYVGADSTRAPGAARRSSRMRMHAMPAQPSSTKPST